MEQVPDVRVTAHLTNHQAGFVQMTVDDWDGGPFGLHPQTDGDTLYLVDPNGARYGLAIRGNNPDAIRRLGHALIELADGQEGS